MSWTSVKQDIVLDKNQNVTFYVDINGIVKVVTEVHACVFSFLEKLGLKCIPNKILTTLTTMTMPAGSYVLSYNTNGNGAAGIATPQLVQTVFTLPSINTKVEVAECKRYYEKKGPSREDRNRWQYASRKHSRNTGRTTGRR